MPSLAQMKKYYRDNPEKCFDYDPRFFASPSTTKVIVGLAKRQYPKEKITGLLAAAEICPPIIKKGRDGLNKKSRKVSRRKTSRRKVSRRKVSRRKVSRRKTSRRKASRRKVSRR